MKTKPLPNDLAGLVAIAEAVAAVLAVDYGLQGTRSGNRRIKPSRLGIGTFGSVWAFIVSFSPMSLFSERM